MGYTSNTSRTTAGLLALVLGLVGLGWLGLHKFNMGYKKEGWTSILISVFLCIVGAAVMNVISIVEGVIYLTKSDAEFYNEYVVNKKPWF
jgi:TM2 domain-containing membrane protein YozV